MALINPRTQARGGPVRLGFKRLVIALFVAIVLVIGLTLVYLSFSRITAITNSAASKFIGEKSAGSGRLSMRRSVMGLGGRGARTCGIPDEISPMTVRYHMRRLGREPRGVAASSIAGGVHGFELWAYIGRTVVVIGPALRFMRD
jgi:hypothetical protein